jgi:hypothetical protein
MAAPTGPLPPSAPSLPPFSKADFERADSLYKIYRAYIEHEDELINHRSTWHLLIQGFLFATFAALGQWQPGPDHYLYDHRFLIVGIVALMGLSIAVCAFFSVDAADKALNDLQGGWSIAKKAAYFPASLEGAFPPLAGGGSPQALKWGKLPALAVPVIVAIAWVILLALDIYVGSQSKAPTQVTTSASATPVVPPESRIPTATQICTCECDKPAKKQSTKASPP